MALTSAPFPVAHVGPIAFTFRSKSQIRVQVRFFEDLEGLVPIAKGTGSRDITVTTTDTFVQRDAVPDYSVELDSDIKDGTQNCAGGEWGWFDLADGMNNISCTLTGGGDPVGALSYRVSVSAPHVRPT